MFIIFQTTKICWTMLCTAEELVARSMAADGKGQDTPGIFKNIRYSVMPLSWPEVVISSIIFDDDRCLYLWFYFLDFWCTNNNKHFFFTLLCPSFLMFCFVTTAKNVSDCALLCNFSSPTCILNPLKLKNKSCAETPCVIFAFSIYEDKEKKLGLPNLQKVGENYQTYFSPSRKVMHLDNVNFTAEARENLHSFTVRWNCSCACRNRNGIKAWNPYEWRCTMILEGYTVKKIH